MKTNQSVRQHALPAESRPHRQPNPPDFSIYGAGTVYLFHPLTATAQAWLDAECPPSGRRQHPGQKLAVEYRGGGEIVHLAIRDVQTPTANILCERSVS